MTTFLIPDAAHYPNAPGFTIIQAGELLSAGNGLPVNIVAGSSAGTQYTDGGTPPANPIGGALVYDNSGAWLDVGVDHPLPVQGTFWQTTQPVSLAALPALVAGSAV